MESPLQNIDRNKLVTKYTQIFQVYNEIFENNQIFNDDAVIDEITKAIAEDLILMTQNNLLSNANLFNLVITLFQFSPDFRDLVVMELSDQIDSFISKTAIPIPGVNYLEIITFLKGINEETPLLSAPQEILGKVNSGLEMQQTFERIERMDRSFDINLLAEELSAFNINLNQIKIAPKKAFPSNWLNNKTPDTYVSIDKKSDLIRSMYARIQMIMLSLMKGPAIDEVLRIIANEIGNRGGADAIRSYLEDFNSIYISKRKDSIVKGNLARVSNSTMTLKSLNVTELQRIENYIKRYMTKPENVINFGLLFGLFDKLPYGNDLEKLNTNAIITLADMLANEDFQLDNLKITEPDFWSKLLQIN